MKSLGIAYHFVNYCCYKYYYEVSHLTLRLIDTNYLCCLSKGVWASLLIETLFLFLTLNNNK